MDREKTGHCIVGVGATTGGLGALLEFFSALPDDCGAAFVVIGYMLHLNPVVLDEMLGACTSLPVSWAEDGIKLQPNRVYLIPEHFNFAVQNGILQENERADSGLLRPIDAFFTSLAKDQQKYAAGVILSGAAHDGWIGMKAIEKHGGLLLVQQPSTAIFKSVPARVIQQCSPDFVLPPGLLAQALSSYLYVHHANKQQRERDN